jgi:hypothetical protein
MDYDDRAFGQQEQEEEAYFFHTLADVRDLTKTFGAGNFFHHLFEQYPELKSVAREYV